jgi:transcriptional regulator with XRE-family HTH domain
MPTIFGEVVKKLRKGKGWSQATLAENTQQGRLPKIDKQTISRLERRKETKSRTRTVQQLARALGVPPQVLMGEVPSPQPSADPIPKNLLRTPISDSHRNALHLVAFKYNVAIHQIVELAPFLFCWAAEASLQQRQKTLQRVINAYEAAREVEKTIGHIPEGRPQDETLEAVIKAETESIDRDDLFGFALADDPDIGGGSPNFDNPFELFLRSLAEDVGNGVTFEYLSPFDAPQYRVCAEEAAFIVNGDADRASEILDGQVSLHELPQDLNISNLSKDAERAEWVRARAQEYRDDIEQRFLKRIGGLQK